MVLPLFFSRLARSFTQTSQLAFFPTMGTSASSSSSAAAAATSAAPILPEGAQRCTVAAGCFWGTEHHYRKHFAGKGLIDAKVGYIGGDTSNPTYRAVCNGNTGHAEAADIIFDPKQVTYRQLLEFFYRLHDPTTPNRQGHDTGSQYRSAIFYHDPEQEKTARDVTSQANQQWYGGRIVTQIIPAGKWWSAEDYHQLYLQNNPGGYECANHYVRPFEPLK